MRWPFPRQTDMDSIYVPKGRDPNEQRLKTKIFQLQIEMMDFNKLLVNTISEENPETSDLFPPLSVMSCDWVRACVLSLSRCLVGLLFVAACMTWPLFFPLFVYLSEGRSYLFWKLVCVSILLVLALTLRIAIELHVTITRWIADSAAAISLLYRNSSEVLNRLWKERSKDPCFRDSFQDAATKMILIASRMPITVPLGVTLVVLLLMLATHCNIFYILCVGLLTSGFLSGVVITNFTKSLNRRENLPYLHLPPRENPISPLECKSPMMPSSPSFLSVSDELTSVCVGKGRFPRSPPPTYQEALRCPPFVHSLHSADESFLKR